MAAFGVALQFDGEAGIAGNLPGQGGHHPIAVGSELGALGFEDRPARAVELEGHTESGHPPVRADYGDWEISSDRASAARRKLLEHGVAAGQIRRVAGYGDTVPMPEAKPEDESNRRITVMLKLRSARN